MSVERPKDKLQLEVNPVTGELDLVKQFNPNRILTHKLTELGNPRVEYDPVQNVYYEADSTIVTDGNGNVIVR